MNEARLTRAEGVDFEQFLAIYEEALPARERKAGAEIKKLAPDPRYTISLLKDESGVIGFSMLFRAQTAPVALLEYMAVRPDKRSAGLGAGLFAQSLAAAQGRPVLAEVDSERETGAKDLALRLRRKAFYRRLGFRQIANLAYELPLPGAGDPPLMDLLVHPNAADAGPLSRAELSRWLAALYQEVYAQRRDDPRLARMLAAIGDPVALT